MAISDDFLIDYNNLRIYNVGSTVYTVNALYSYIMDTFDELVQMQYTIPMSAQTPTAYTMTNGWFIDDDSTHYLSGGAIATSGYLNVIQVVTLISGGYFNAIPTDIGLMVTDDGGNTGNLLAYNNTTRKWWIRWNATVVAGSTMAIIPAGTGAGVSVAAPSATGEDLYSNLYTLGTIDSSPYPQVYIYQAGVRIAEWSTLSNFDRGHIDILLKVQESAVLIDGGNVYVFARQYTDSYDNFGIDLSAGGRNAVPLSTAKDLNNVTGEYYLFYDGAGSNFTTMNQIVTGGTSGATAQLVTATSWGGNLGVLTLCGIRGVFQDNEAITGSIDGARTTNGTVGDTYLAYNTQTGAFTVGQVLTGTTSLSERLIVGDQDDGVTGKLCLKVQAIPTAVDYTPYQDTEAITDPVTGAAVADGASTTIVAGYSDIVIAFVNGTATHAGIAGGPFLANEILDYVGGAAAGGTGVFILENAGTMTIGDSTNTNLFAGGATTITGRVSGATAVATANLVSAHTTPKAYPLGTPYNYDVVVDCAGRRLSQVYEYFKFSTRDASQYVMYTVTAGVITPIYGEEYTIAYVGYAPVKADPMGTFAGGRLFGAQGIWVENMNALDIMNYQLIDSSGATQNPPTFALISVTSVVAGDRVAVYRTTGGTTIDEAMYSSTATNTAGDSDFVVTAAIANDTPSSGVLELVANTSVPIRQFRVRYASWATSTFTFPTKYTAATTAGGGATVITDGLATFNVDDIQYGDIVRNVTDGSWAQVVSVDGPTQVTTTPLQDGATNLWNNLDVYEFNTLPFTFTITTDKAYVPFIDAQAAGTSVSVTVIYVADRTVLIRVRKKFILPFETPNTVTSTGMTQAAIRTPDAICT